MSVLDIFADYCHEIDTPENPLPDRRTANPKTRIRLLEKQLPIFDKSNPQKIYALHNVKDNFLYVRKPALSEQMFKDLGVEDYLSSQMFVDERRVKFFQNTADPIVYVFDLTKDPIPVTLPTDDFEINLTAKFEYDEKHREKRLKDLAEGKHVCKKRIKQLFPLIEKNKQFFELNLFSFEKYPLLGSHYSETVHEIDGCGLAMDTYKTPYERGTVTIGYIYKRNGVGYVGKEQHWVLIDSRTVQEWELDLRLKGIKVDFKDDARFSHVENRYLGGETKRLMAFDMLRINETPRRAKPKSSPNETRAKRAVKMEEWKTEYEKRMESGECDYVTSLPLFLQENAHRRGWICRRYGDYLYVIVRELMFYPFNYKTEAGYMGNKVIYFKPWPNVTEQFVGSVYCAMYNIKGMTQG